MMIVDMGDIFGLYISAGIFSLLDLAMRQDFEIYVRLFEKSLAAGRSWGRCRPPPPLGHPLARRREENERLLLQSFALRFRIFTAQSFSYMICFLGWSRYMSG